jgi:hypothetical protein
VDVAANCPDLNEIGVLMANFVDLILEFLNDFGGMNPWLGQEER